MVPMLTATSDSLARFTAFRVDDVDYPGGPLTWYFHCWVGGLFTADADAVAERLPMPGLHPLRLRPGRALLMVEGASLRQERTGLPPTRGAFVAVSVMITTGPAPAPVLLPLLSDRVGRRYKVGVVPLRFLITNHVEAQLFAGQLGFDMRPADIERRLGQRDEEFACSWDGQQIARLRVRTDGRAARSLPVLTFYSVRDGQPFRMSLSNPSPGATRLGRQSARLDLTGHESVADLRELRISPSSWMGVAKTDSRWHATTPPQLLGDVCSAARPPVTDYRAGRFTERLGASQATQIDDGLDALPFDPNGTIDVPPLALAGATSAPARSRGTSGSSAGAHHRC